MESVEWTRRIPLSGTVDSYVCKCSHRQCLKASSPALLKVVIWMRPHASGHGRKYQELEE